jgi:outer membrane receptor for ferrienterochelin and colicins
MSRSPLLVLCLLLMGGRAAAQTVPADAGVRTLDELLDTRISSAAKYEQTARAAPGSVTVITAEDIEEFGYRTLDEVLMTTVGFQTSYDRNYAYLGVRGLSRPTDYNNRVLLLLDGHGLNENVYGSAGIGTEFALDLTIVERIEIVRGPGSSLFGTGAMFAVVNVITKKGGALQGGRVSAEVGDHDHRRASAMFGRELASGLDVLISGTWRDTGGKDLYYPEFDSPATNNGVAQRLDGDRAHGLFARLSYRSTVLSGFLSTRTKAFPTGAYDTVFNDPRAFTRDRQRFLTLTHDLGVGAGKKLFLRGFWSHYGYDGSYPYDALYTDGSRGDWSGAEAQLQWDLRPNHRIAFGAEYREHWRVDHFVNGVHQSLPFHVASASVEDTWEPVEKVSLTLGLRHDDYSTVGSATTPRAAVVVDVRPSAKLKVLYGSAFRAPSAYEAGFADTITGFTINPDLKPERVRTFEVVWDQRLSKRLQGTASLYHSRVEDLIDPVIDEVRELRRYGNVATVQARGLELGLLAHVRGWRGYSSYAVQSTTDGATGMGLTNSPSQSFKAGASGPLQRRLRAAAQMQYETARRTLQGTSTSPFLLVNANLSAEPVFGRLSVSLHVRNLFDTAYSLPGGVEHRQAAIAQDGRSLRLSVDVRF